MIRSKVMAARILYVAVAVAVLVGCYDVPRPACGFACGADGACPADYACNAADNRCHLTGSTATCAPAIVDAGPRGPDSSDDLIAPEVIGFAPSPNAGGVALGTSIAATFSEPVINVSEVTFLLRHNGTDDSGSVSYDASADTAFFGPSVPLLPDTVYTATVLTAITDLAGNPIRVPVTWQFTTLPDTLPPTVTDQAPIPDDIEVGVAASVSARFSEHVIGLSTTSFMLTTGSTAVPGSVTYSQSALRALFNPTSQLLANTVYTATLTGAITDPSGNVLAASPVIWTFTTGADTIAPHVLGTMPPINATGVAITSAVAITFDESVVMANGTTVTLSAGGSPVAATVTYDPGTHTATLQPDLPLVANTIYTVTLGSAIADTAGNPVTGIMTWMFTTAP
jgi:hypothetical protein